MLKYTNPASGPEICTDLETSGEHVQLVKLAFGAEDATERVARDTPLPVTVTNDQGGAIALPTYVSSWAAWPNPQTFTASADYALVGLCNRNNAAGTRIAKVRSVMFTAVASVSCNFQLLLSRGEMSTLMDGDSTSIVGLDPRDPLVSDWIARFRPPLASGVVAMSRGIYRSDSQNDAIWILGRDPQSGAKPLTLRPGEICQLIINPDKAVNLLWTLSVFWTEEPAT